MTRTSGHVMEPDLKESHVSQKQERRVTFLCASTISSQAMKLLALDIFEL